MSQIRKQSIISTIFVYTGIAIGFINTFLFLRYNSLFKPSEYALTQVFIQVGYIIFAFANMGMIATVYKFYPYYNDNLDKKKNDLLSWAFLISIIGFVFVLFAGYVFKDLVIRKFGRSPEFIKYYFWIFPFGFSILVYSILEVFAWNIRKSVFTNFLKEILFRLLTTILIFLFSYKIINSFDGFIKFYSFTYGIVAATLFGYLIYKKQFYLTFTISRVTKKFYKKIIALATLVYFGGIVFMIAQFIDTIVIMSVVGINATAIFLAGSVVAGLIQAPQRGAVAASIPVLSRAWKDKDYAKITLIYQRSGINLLIASLGIFLLVWLNYADGIKAFGLKPVYLQSQWIFFFLGLARIVDLGTGVNAQIIGTSTYWRFEFLSGVVLLSLAVPLNYFLVKKFGIIGSGYSNLFSFTVYNVIRIIFLKRKFNMHPFSNKTIYAIILAVVCYVLCYYTFGQMHGFLGMTIRSLVFITLYGGSIIYFDLTPDVIPVWKMIRKRTRGK
ncbi:MAG: polysaccharide biosynthesis C-terminal domain-containing protein [Chitinophagaceae bacterium]|nr:polysaccharide biosynthesis C-terminal domain-containing protein [Chitinophagaceae bacterium]